MTEDHLACTHCALPINRGDARWAAREPQEFWHYECAHEAGLSLPPPIFAPRNSE